MDRFLSLAVAAGLAASGFAVPVVTVGYDAGNLPKIFVDGKPQYPFIDLCGCANYVGQQWVSDYVSRTKDVAGPRIWSVGFDDYAYLKPDGTRDWTFLDEKVASLLKADPDAQLMLFIRFRYERWAKAHPEECVGYAGEAMTPGSPDEWAGVPVRPSSASIPFRAEVFKDLQTMADYVKRAPWGDRVVGTRICYGVATEWFTYGTCAYPDNGVAMTKEFRRWLREKYGTDEALRAAWADDAVTLDTAEIPSKEMQAPKTLFLDPLENRRTVDFNAMSADSMADLLIAVARETKRVLPGRLVGAYYGYILNAWPGNSANFLIDKVLASGQVDFLSDMADYNDTIRQAGGGYDHKAIASAVRRYGKLQILEDDTRFHFMTNWAPGCRYISRSAREDAVILKRNILNTLFDREGYQVCDPIAGKGKPGRLHAFDDPRILAVQRETFGVLKDVTSLPADSGADMALVVNYRDKFYGDTHKIPPGGRAWTWWEIYREAPAAMHRSGAVFDILTLNDLLATQKRYRKLVFLNGYALSGDERRGIKELTHAKGVTAVWFVAPGSLTKTGFSDAGMSDLTGVELKGAAANPEVVCTDAAAVPVAVATGGWMKKLDGGATALFFPKMPTEPKAFAAIFDIIGEHRYTQPGPYVRRDGDYLMLHVGAAGRYALTLPDAEGSRSLKELFSGRTYGPDARTFETDGPETWFFKIQ